MAVAYSRQLLKRKLTRGTGGNISIINRESGLFAITPSGIEYDAMSPEQVAVLDMTGRVIEGDAKPSSEMEMHLCCYQSRSDVNAIVHTHSTYATIIACMHREIPPVHYLIGFAGGSVPCIPYYPFGSHELAVATAEAFGAQPDQFAILLGNHGLLAVGADMSYAFNTAEEIEFVAEVYYKILIANEVHTLSAEDMNIVREKFAEYGQKQPCHGSTEHEERVL